LAVPAKFEGKEMKNPIPGFSNVQKWALANQHSSVYQWMEPSIGSWHG